MNIAVPVWALWALGVVVVVPVLWFAVVGIYLFAKLRGWRIWG